MTEINISRKTAVKMITDNGYKEIFGAKHIKKEDGALRDGSYKLGVRKGTSGAGLKYNPSEKNLIPVRDMNKGFRMIWIDGLKEITINKQVYKIESEG